MIKGLYETHLFVEDLERSIAFYRDVLGLKQCYYEEARRAAFFWIGRDKEQMLGLWEKPKEEIDLRHFAFESDAEWILNHSVHFLESHDLYYWNFLQDDSKRPMVFSWMPSLAIYFLDPDGHYLEFISVLPGEGIPDKGVVSWDDWKELSGNSEELTAIENKQNGKMIKGLYETHLFVEDLERSIEFYKNVLGLQQCRFNDERRLAFFWIGEEKQAMLGLWEMPKEEVVPRHFAFESESDWILNDSVDFLKSNDLTPWNFLNDGTDQPMVFTWTPAISIYFADPDGHYLEFISVLPGDAHPERQTEVVSWEEWQKIKD